MLEGQETKQNFAKSLVSLSAQNLLDCSHRLNRGCAGGSPVGGLQFVQSWGGIEAEASYPYTGRVGECRFNSSRAVMSVPHVAIGHGEEARLKLYVQNAGPIATSIATPPELIAYKSGVIDLANCATKPENLTHSVLIVGFGHDPQGGDHWIVVSHRQQTRPRGPSHQPAY